MFLGHTKQPNHLHRVGEVLAVRDTQPPALVDKAFEVAPEQAAQGQAEPRFAAVLFLQCRAKNARQIADGFCHQVVMLHEAFDGARVGAGPVAESLGQFDLGVEREPLFRPPGQVVKLAAYGPQKRLGAAEPCELRARQYFLVDQLIDAVDAVEVLGDPKKRMQIAQAALAVFDVGLDEVARVAKPAMAGIALGEFRLDKIGAGAARFCCERASEVVVQAAVAPHEARLQDRRADRDVGAAKAQAFIDRACRVSHLEAEVPQKIQQVLDDLFAPRGQFVGMQEQEIDVRVGRHLAAPVAANRDHAQAFSRRRIGHPIDMPGGMVVKRAHDLIDQERSRPRNVAARGAGFEPPADLIAASREDLAHDIEDTGARRRRFSVAVVGKRIKARRQTLPVDNRPLAGNAIHGKPNPSSGVAKSPFGAPRTGAHDVYGLPTISESRCRSARGRGADQRLALPLPLPFPLPPP